MSSSTRRAKLLTSAVFFLAFLRIAWQADSTGIASGYIDPVARIAAQDEAVYTHTSIRMATQGGWLTPKFLGRFAFYKPPLLYWLSASAGRLFGISPLALRIPSVVGGAAVAALVFWWALRMEGLVAGIGAVLLLGSTYLWYTLGTLNLTDMLLTCCITAAALCLFVDPQLRRRHVWLGLAFAIAGALMTKGVAGAVPLLICAGVWFSASESTRMIRIAQVVGLAAAFALPWYVYQLMAHPRWFWAEFVLLENLSFGLGSPPQTTSEGQLQFYLRRLVLLDLPLLCAAIAALPVWWKRKGHDRAVLIVWMTAMGLAILGFRYRNAAYLLPLMPALCLWAAPVLKWKPVSLILIPAILCWRGVPFQRGTTLPSAPPLSEYCRQSRSNELLIVAPDDEFYASVLPLSRVRYVYLE
ncbi:MAG TPA: glycosyltransferase family 39 protein, partial [Bryobacteraceae bacterium]|nr:glycosyltransferase family 39 protein [Bryobacteraceae bacterium]